MGANRRRAGLEGWLGQCRGWPSELGQRAWSGAVPLPPQLVFNLTSCCRFISDVVGTR